MLTRIIFLSLILLSGIGEGHAQKKIKYKHIYPMIEAGNYKGVESDLRAFIAQNDDHANSHLHMAILLRKQLDTLDRIAQRERFMELADSVILYYQKAKSLIDDREIRKNDDFYIAYNRRDLRTGKTGIKLSDIHLDIEDRIKQINRQKQEINLTFSELKKLEKEFSDLIGSYKAITDQFKDINQLYLLYDEDIEAKLKQLGIKNDVFLRSYREFDNQAASLSSQEKREAKPKLINDFKKDGYDTPDFLADEIYIWDYKQWVNDLILVAGNEVRSLKNQLVDFGKKNKKIKDEIKLIRRPDQVEFTKLDESVASQLKKYEKEAVIIDLLNYKQKEVQLEIMSSPLSNPVLRDTVFVDSLYNTYDRLAGIAADMEKIGNKITDAKYINILSDYKKVIEPIYGDYNKVLGEIKESHAALRVKKADFEDQKSAWLEKSKWAIFDEFKIPLTSTSEFSEEDSIHHQTLHIIRSNFKGQYAAGIKDDNYLFLAEVNPNKAGKWYWEEELDELNTIDNIYLKYDRLKCLMFVNFNNSENALLYLFDAEGKVEWKTELNIGSKIKEIEIGDSYELISENNEILNIITKDGELMN